MVFLMHFGLFRKKRGSSLFENHQEMAAQASHWQLRQMRDYFVYELEHIEGQIVALGGISQFQKIKETGGNLGRFQRLFERRSNPDNRAPDRAQCVHKEGGLGKLDLNAICDAFWMVSQIIFRIFTLDGISDGISDAFRIFECREKKN